MRFVQGPDKVYFSFSFFHFPYLNLKKIGLGGEEIFKIMNPGTVWMISRNASCQPRGANVAVRGNSSGS
jgi:hypothetical protein